MTHGGSSALRLDRLTSLRLFAALAVFGFHATAFFDGPTREVLDFIFGQGRSGVTFFFILSGFVLAWSARPGDRARAFYRRRFARIYPVYIVTLGFAATLWALRDPSALLRGPLTPFLLQAWVPDSSTYFAINVPAWSLSVEAFFYLLFPLAIVWFRRLSTRSIWITCVVLVLMTTTIAFYASLTTAPGELADDTFAVWFSIYFPVARFPEFLLGVALALLMKRGALLHIPWAMALLLVFATWASMSVWPSIYSVSAAYMIPFGALIVSAAQRDVRGVPGWLRSPLIVQGGAISYAFYLLHHILIMRLSQQGFADLGFSGWFASVSTLILSLIGAWMLHRFVELPADRMLRGRREQRSVQTPVDGRSPHLEGR
ncbi:acyltransferase family protein [Arthrobacter sp. D2-10]